jgi:hypothetical protein
MSGYDCRLLIGRIRSSNPTQITDYPDFNRYFDQDSSQAMNTVRRIYMDLRLATLKAVSFYLLHNVSTLNQCRELSCGTVVCKHFASYQDYPNYKWDLIR